MGSEMYALVRRTAQGIAVLCAVGTVWLAGGHDWSDAALIGLLGAWALVTARKMTWKLRRGPEWASYSAWPDTASSTLLNPAAPISSSWSSNHTV